MAWICKECVPVEGLLGLTIEGGVLEVTRKVPLDEGLVTTAREEHVGALGRGGNGGNPTIVALEDTAKSQRFTHDVSEMRTAN